MSFKPYANSSMYIYKENAYAQTIHGFPDLEKMPTFFFLIFFLSAYNDQSIIRGVEHYILQHVGQSTTRLHL